MAELEGEINERVAALTPAKQRQVLEYIRSLGKGPTGAEWLEDLPIISKEFANELRAALPEQRRVTGTPGRDLLRFAGIWTDEEADEIRRLIEDERERIDTDAW